MTKSIIKKAGSDEGWSGKFPLHIRWELSNYCNFSFSYCSHAQSEEYSKLLKVPLDLLKRGVDQLATYKDPIEIDLFGGEPTQIEGLLDLWLYIAEKMPNAQIEAISNASPPISYFEEFIKKLSPYKERSSWTFSYHLEECDLDAFIEKINLLSSHGFKVYVTFMSHPKRFQDIKVAYERIAQSSALNIYVKKLYGYKEKNIYSPEYLSWINERDKNPKIFFIDDGESKKYYSIVELLEKDLNQFKGMYCEKNHCLVITHTGQVRNACSYNSKEFQFRNNVFLTDNSLKKCFFDELKTSFRCNSDTCTCADDIEIRKWL